MSGERYSTCLWFNGQAEEAVRYYTTLLADAEQGEVFRPAPTAPAVSIGFRLGGQQFLALNDPAAPPFTAAASIVVRCTDQDQVDVYWEALTAGGSPGRCGWLTDRFGVSWQIVPDRLLELLQSDRSGAVLRAMLQMDKIVIADLEAAADGDA